MDINLLKCWQLFRTRWDFFQLVVGMTLSPIFVAILLLYLQYTSDKEYNKLNKGHEESTFFGASKRLKGSKVKAIAESENEDEVEDEDEAEDGHKAEAQAGAQAQAQAKAQAHASTPPKQSKDKVSAVEASNIEDDKSMSFDPENIRNIVKHFSPERSLLRGDFGPPPLALALALALALTPHPLVQPLPSNFILILALAVSVPLPSS